MVNATIDNTPVSIQLNTGQSTTVPTNETWKVTISVFANKLGDRTSFVVFELNGKKMFGMVGNNGGGPMTSPSGSFVLTGGDTLKLTDTTAGNPGGSIQGFIVDS